MKKQIGKRFDHVNNHRWDEAVKAVAPHVHHHVSGAHALGGERHGKEALRRWFERLGRVLPTVQHPQLVLFLIIVFSVAGLMSYLNLGRAEDPSFAIKTMVISAAWPGATAEEMQDQVADKLEKRLQELELFDYVKTYTRPGVTVIQVQLKDTARQKEVDDAWYQVRKKLNDSRPTLPQGVQGPFFNDEYGDVYTAIYMLSGPDVSLAKLKDYAEVVRQRLLRTEGVAKVDIVGEREQRIFIEFSHRKLATLGITPQTIFNSVARQNAVTAAGTIETSADRIDVRVTGAFKGEAAIGEVPIEAGAYGLWSKPNNITYFDDLKAELVN